MTPRDRPRAADAWRTIVIILSASALWLTDGIHHLDPARPAAVVDPRRRAAQGALADA